MDSKTTSQPAGDENAGIPNETARGIASLFLILHLFCVLLVLSASIFASSLQIRLSNLFHPYTRLLNLELYNTSYNLTHAARLDVDLRIELLPKGKEEGNLENWIVLPDVGTQGGDRYQRYQRLAYILANAATNDDKDTAARITEKIAENFLHQNKIEIEKLRCRRHTLQGAEVIRGNELGLRDPWNAVYFQVLYEANVFQVNGDVHVVEKLSAGKTAKPDSGKK